MKYKLFIILIIFLFIPQIAYSKSNLEKLELYPDSSYSEASRRYLERIDKVLESENFENED
jgi:hypothetical protein